METQIALAIGLGLTVFIVSLCFTCFIQSHMKKSTERIIAVIENEIARLKDDLEGTYDFTCTNPVCGRRTTSNEYLNKRLLEIGYQAHLRRAEDDRAAIEKGFISELCKGCGTKDVCESIKNKLSVADCEERTDPPPAGEPDPLPLCQLCHVWSACVDRDDAKTACITFVPRKDTDKHLYDEVTKSNKEAAESVKGDTFNGTNILIHKGNSKKTD